MSGLERSLLQHGIEISGWLLHPSGRPEEDAPDADEPDTGDRLQDHISPPALLPNTLGAALQRFAEELGDPAEAYYLVLLCVAASLIPSKTTLLADARFRLSAPPILWGGLMGCSNSGYRIINTLTRPLKDLQIEHHTHRQQRLKDRETALRACERGQKGDPTGEIPDPPIPVELWTSDCRAGVVELILARQPDRGLLIVPDNLAEFLQESGAWPGGRRSDRTFWWRLHSGLPLEHSSGITFVTLTPHPSVSVIGGISHDPLRVLWTKRTQTGFDFWPCFAWVDVPPRYCAEDHGSVPHSLRRLLVDVYRCLQASPPMQHVLDEEGNQLWSCWRRELLSRVRNACNYKVQMLLSHAFEKAARIALVLHRLDAACIGAIPSVIVPARTLDRGMGFAMWLEQQAEAGL